MDFLQKLGRRLLEIAPTRVVLLTAGDDTSGVFVIVLGTDSRLDLNAAGREIAEILGGRGSGDVRNDIPLIPRATTQVGSQQALLCALVPLR